MHSREKRGKVGKSGFPFLFSFPGKQCCFLCCTAHPLLWPQLGQKGARCQPDGELGMGRGQNTANRRGRKPQPGNASKIVCWEFSSFFKGGISSWIYLFLPSQFIVTRKSVAKGRRFPSGKNSHNLSFTLVKPVVLAPVSNFGSWKLRGALGQYSNRSNCRLQCEGCFSNEPVSPTIAASFTRHTNRLLWTSCTTYFLRKHSKLDAPSAFLGSDIWLFLFCTNIYYRKV